MAGARHAVVLRRSPALLLLSAAVVAAASCGGAAREAGGGQRNCINGWNAATNTPNQRNVAGTSMYAKVDVSGDGCTFAFHGDDPRLRLLSGRWDGDRLVIARPSGSRALAVGLPHGTPPSNEDNAVVTLTGRLLPAQFPASTRIVKPDRAPKWLLLRARRDTILYRDPAPRAIEISPRGNLWRIVLRGRFRCDICNRPIGKPKLRATVIEEFEPDTKAGAGISYG